MSNWHKGPLAAFDTESTGLDVENDRIVTATVALIRPGEPTDVRSHLIAVDIDIPAEATAVHGVTTEYARANGGKAVEVLDAIAADLALAVRATVPIVGMHCPYDLTLLDRELRRNGLPTLEDRIGGPIRPVIDVMTIDKAVEKFRKGKRRLTDLCATYNVRIDGAHDSAHDALAAARVAWAIANRYPHIAGMDLLDLHDAQVRWCHEQTDSFRAHLMRQQEELLVQAGRTDDSAARELAEQDAAGLDRRIDSLNGSWPMIPFGGAV